MKRRSLAAVVASGVLVAGAVAAALVFALPGKATGPTRAQYLARVSAVCEKYGRKLDRIPPPIDIASPGNVLATVRPALAILREQEARIRAIEPPRELRERVARFFVLTDRSIAALDAVRRAAANTDVAGIGIGLQRFGTATNAAKAAARQIGYSC